MIVGAVGVYLLHWPYRHSSGDQSLVRTGPGGERVVTGRGALVIPIVDARRAFPGEFVAALIREGYLAAMIPGEHGGLRPTPTCRAAATKRRPTRPP